MELAERTESELHDLYVLKYGSVGSLTDLFAIPSDEDLRCPIKREYAFRYMMRNLRNQSTIIRRLRNAEMEINNARLEMRNSVQQLNAKQSVLQHPYNPAIQSTSNQSTPYPPAYYQPTTL